MERQGNKVLLCSLLEDLGIDDLVNAIPLLWILVQHFLDEFLELHIDADWYHLHLFVQDTLLKLFKAIRWKWILKATKLIEDDAKSPNVAHLGTLVRFPQLW